MTRGFGYFFPSARGDPLLVREIAADACACAPCADEVAHVFGRYSAHGEERDVGERRADGLYVSGAERSRRNSLLRCCFLACFCSLSIAFHPKERRAGRAAPQHLFFNVQSPEIIGFDKIHPEAQRIGDGFVIVAGPHSRAQPLRLEQL